LGWAASDDALWLVFKLFFVDSVYYQCEIEAMQKAVQMARQLAEAYGGDTEDEETGEAAEDDSDESDWFGG
jgi:hypothetical protein